MAQPLPGDIGCFTIGESGIGVVADCPPGVTPPFLKTILSYLYWEYQDDDDLLAFVDAYNNQAQLFANWFNSLNLPIYTGSLLDGDPPSVVYGVLLEWVISGLYGLPKPVIAEGKSDELGPYDTFAYDTLAYDGHQVITRINYLPTTDDIFRRVLTWHFFKGDGRRFTVRWLKRRVMQFLTGTNGIPVDIDQTYRISVSFGLQGQLNITLLRWTSAVTGYAGYDAFAYDMLPYDWTEVALTQLGPQFAMAYAFKYAIDSGVLELPFRFTPVVVVQS